MIKWSKQLFIYATYGLVNSIAQAYSLLGLQEGASNEEIKAAFKNKALKLHPDINKSPSANEDMQLLNAAKDFLLNNNKQQEIPISQSEPEVVVPEENPFDLSYEEISELRDRMGRDEFEKKFPGWTGELRREIGLDAYNKLFEKYDPNYNPYDDPYYAAQIDQLYDQVKDTAWEIASNLYDKGMEDKIIDIYTRVDSLVEKYPDIAQPPSWIEKKGLLKEFNKLLVKEFDDRLLDNLDEFEIPLDFMLSFPNEKVISAFLSKEGNIEKYDLPDKLLSSKDFGRAFILMLKHNEDVAEKFIDKYRGNKAFIDGIMQSTGFLHYIRDNGTAKILIKSIKFDPDQRKIIDRWLNFKQ